MSITLTPAARQSVRKISKEPSLVVIFDGIDEVFGSAQIFRFIKIGDPGLLIGDDWKIGGRVAVGEQVTGISFDQGTTTRIEYSLTPDLAVGEAVSSMVVRLVDDRALTVLGVLSQNEFLGRKCRVVLAPDPNDTVYPEDYITIFRGIVDDISLSPGVVSLTISHPDAKKRQAIFTSAEGEVDEALDASDTTITLDDTADILDRITGPDGTKDTSYSTYIKIDDEIIQFTGISGNDLTGCTRGALGTTAASHDLGAAWKTFYRLEGNSIDLALKIMLSGWKGPFKTGVAVTHFNFLSVDESVTNSIFFSNVNVLEEYGLTAGDYITTVGSAEAANNVTDKTISQVVVTGQGSYIVVSDVTFTPELDSSATISFRSKYDTLGDGLRMSPDEVDVEQHERLRSLFLSSFDYEFYLKETISSGKEFISSEIYRPIACYSVPRKARASVAYTVGPLPFDEIKTLNTSNVLDPNKITKKRSTGRNFYNTIIYKFDEDVLTEQLLKGYIDTDATSRVQIAVGTRALTINARGLRDANVAVSNASRRLNRYAFAADYIPQVTVTFEAGFNIEVADLVLLDGVSLQIANTFTGLSTSPTQLYEVVSKSLDIKTGRVTLGLTDTNFAAAQRYALISPASYVKSGISASAFIIESSFSSVFGNDEYLKWTDFGECFIRVRNDDYSVAGTAQIDSFSGNTVRLQNSLGFTPSAGMLMEFSDYAQATDQIKLIYTHITNGSAQFDDGGSPYVMV